MANRLRPVAGSRCCVFRCILRVCVGAGLGGTSISRKGQEHIAADRGK